MSAHMFAGASTPMGFVDLFDNILPVDEARARLFLKGSSGSGKSTFMKKVATRFETRGISVERFHCANDAQSLDAIMIPSIGLSIVDATSPHAHDPEIAIAIDRILDFAQFIDKSKLEPHLGELKSLSANKKLLAKKVTGYLAAIGNMYDVSNSAFENALDKHAIKNCANQYLNEIMQYAQAGVQNNKGRSRKLFLSALTPDGFVSYADKLFEDCKIYGISCDIGYGANIFLEELRDLAIPHGINVTSFYNPLSPERVEYLYFPQISTAFVRTDGSFAYTEDIDKEVGLNNYINKETLEAVSVLEPDCGMFDRVLDKAVSAMYCARKLHARTEEIYVSAMDFDALNRVSEDVIQGLLELIDNN